MKNFLAVVKYFGDEYYVYEDDADLNKDYIEEPLPLPTTDNPNFKFPDYSLARQVR